MKIKQIVVQGVDADIEIRATESGAVANLERVGGGSEVIAEFGRHESRESRYEKAVDVAMHVYGRARGGRAAATNSMVHDVLGEIERLAGC